MHSTKSVRRTNVKKTIKILGISVHKCEIKRSKNLHFDCNILRINGVKKKKRKKNFNDYLKIIKASQNILSVVQKKNKITRFFDIFDNFFFQG